MSYKDAIEDGILTEKDSNGFDWYYPPCRICGAPVGVWKYIHGAEYTCKGCRESLIAFKNNDKKTTSKSKKEKKLAEAVKRIGKVADIAKYDEAIIKVRNNFDNPLFYQSTEEIMVALELLRKGIVGYHQVCVYNYRVDFVIPQYKVALEIDGVPFHGKEKQNYAQQRDEIIVGKLGNDYEIIHITTSSINTNITRLIPAIKAVLKKRRRVQLSAVEFT